MIADRVIRLLEELGTKYVFGVTGSTTVSLVSSISESKQIKLISSLNENSSLAMADGYSRASGEIGVVLLHTTPGLTTALPNLYNSYVDNVPLLVLVGDVNSKFLIKEPGLALDGLENLAKPVTQWTYYAKSGSDIFAALERSASILNSSQPGPCCIILPEDILELEESRSEKEPVLTRHRNTVKPDGETVSQIISLMDQSEWPVLIVGREIKEKSAVNALVNFCTRLSIPVLLESPYPSAYSVGYPQNNPCYLGLFRREAEALKGVDLVVALGGQLVTERKYYEEDPFNNSTKIVHITSDSWQLGKNVRTDVSLLASPELTALAFDSLSKTKAGNSKLRKSRAEKIQQIFSKKESERTRFLSKGGKDQLKPWELVKTLKESLAREDYVIIDEGVMASSYLSELFVFDEPGTLIGRSAGCLGWGIGAAIGAKLALPDKKVISFVGDGAFMFAPQGLWTAAHYDIPITVVVCNNAGYSSVKLSFDSFGKRTKRKVIGDGTDILKPKLDIVKLGEALGVEGFSIENRDQLLKSLKSALSSDHVTLLDVHLDPNERGYEGSLGLNSAWT
ncbi:MAG: thiamine pyrophosphate-binding protein [Thaumarchaeota archaeon]|nr:thiamine pyrophosphate-binding protein [Nitrososphaerota archaeon]